MIKQSLKNLPLGELIDRLLDIKIQGFKDKDEPYEEKLSRLKTMDALKEEISSREVGRKEEVVVSNKPRGVTSLGKLF